MSRDILQSDKTLSLFCQQEGNVPRGEGVQESNNQIGAANESRPLHARGGGYLGNLTSGGICRWRSGHLTRCNHNYQHQLEI